MSTRFETGFQGSPSDLLNDAFGMSVVYTPKGRTGLSVTARWSPGEFRGEVMPDGEQAVERGVLRMNPADVPNPSEQDTVTVRGATWVVTEIITRSPVLAVQCEKRALRSAEGEKSRISRR